MERDTTTVTDLDNGNRVRVTHGKDDAWVHFNIDALGPSDLGVSFFLAPDKAQQLADAILAMVLRESAA